MHFAGLKSVGESLKPIKLLSQQCHRTIKLSYIAKSETQKIVFAICNNLWREERISSCKYVSVDSLTPSGTVKL